MEQDVKSIIDQVQRQRTATVYTIYVRCVCKCDLIARQICSNHFVQVGCSVDINKNMSNIIMTFPKGSIHKHNMVCT